MPDAPLDWPALAAGGFPFPGAVPLPRLLAELAGMLASPDPVVRDDHAYTALARWTREGRLDAVLAELGDTGAERLGHAEAQARAFAPLVLRCAVERWAEAPATVPAARVAEWYERFRDWYPEERDTRGWDDRLGWLHAVAHGADAAAAFGAALPERRVELLRLCALRMTAAHAVDRYAQLEDARLARAVCRLLAAPGLGEGEAVGWLDVVSGALEGGGPGPVPVWASNTFATLQSLHLHLTRGLAREGVPPHAPAVAERVAGILVLPCWWLA
ncbi:DUF2785 domain-containing protein [Streptomyces roseolilacinus]|uniref:DUF2785 domain-containing protein n=1 Tax=Streptomyces roseolilacinus TaxID=66904 RepID=A0A918EK96_9ACTN|nr:DUF2785 domain-containing protein [Streptomyces roseolilacinus]GGQ13026.1 hypothetical protein GCM10010249_34730 [Streptomyces roseolilacinus]